MNEEDFLDALKYGDCAKMKKEFIALDDETKAEVLEAFAAKSQKSLFREWTMMEKLYKEEMKKPVGERFKD